MPKNTHGYRICHRNMININLYLIDITSNLIFGQIFHKEALLESKEQDNDFKKYLSMANFI